MLLFLHFHLATTAAAATGGAVVVVVVMMRAAQVAVVAVVVVVVVVVDVRRGLRHVCVAHGVHVLVVIRRDRVMGLERVELVGREGDVASQLERVAAHDEDEQPDGHLVQEVVGGGGRKEEEAQLDRV